MEQIAYFSGRSGLLQNVGNLLFGVHSILLEHGVAVRGRLL